MSVDTSAAVRAHEENWLPILELSIEEVFEIMLGCRAKPVPESEHRVSAEVTAVVGLAGALCGMLAIACDGQTAREIAQRLLGETAESEEQVSDAIGEICNMVAGNFKNKLTGLDGRCLLSVPTVIIGREYNFRSLAAGNLLESYLMFGHFPITVRLELHV